MQKGYKTALGGADEELTGGKQRRRGMGRVQFQLLKFKYKNKILNILLYKHRYTYAPNRNLLVYRKQTTVLRLVEKYFGRQAKELILDSGCRTGSFLVE